MSTRRSTNCTTVRPTKVAIGYQGRNVHCTILMSRISGFGQDPPAEGINPNLVNLALYSQLNRNLNLSK
jgi:hypothetical protein